VKPEAAPADGKQKGWQIFLSLQGISPTVVGKSWVREGEICPFFKRSQDCCTCISRSYGLPVRDTGEQARHLQILCRAAGPGRTLAL